MFKKLSLILLLITTQTLLLHQTAKSKEITKSWQDILQDAKYQTVNFYAWGGDDKINKYFNWLSLEVKKKFNINLKHIKITDTAIAVRQVIAAKTSSPKDTNSGKIDIIWINGENFASLKNNNLLYGPFLEKLPNYELLDIKNNPNLLIDFQTKVDGFEAPFGKAQLVFIANSKNIKKFPSDHLELKKWIIKNPNRFAYPQIPNFVGSTFVKQILVMLNPNETSFYQPVTTDIYNKSTKKLWLYLDEIKPYLWQKGKNYPKSHSEQIRMLYDNQVDIALTFNPNQALTEILSGDLPKHVKTHAFSQGTIGNTHYLAIPYNAKSKSSALVVINFLLSKDAQNRKADVNIWGDPAVISGKYLDKSNLDPSLLDADKNHPILQELHPSWIEKLEEDWINRYLMN